MREQVTGVVLAGGKARRMGGTDKGLVALNGRPMVTYVLEALAPQTKTIIINANRNLEQYAEYGFAVVPDRIPDYGGPLVGIASAMEAADTPWIVTAPCDSPLLSAELVARLYRAQQASAADLAVAHDGERMQPVFALLHTALLSSLLAFLARDEHKIDRWYAEHRIAITDFSDLEEMFVNVNTPDERDALALRLRTQSTQDNDGQSCP